MKTKIKKDNSTGIPGVVVETGIPITSYSSITNKHYLVLDCLAVNENIRFPKSELKMFISAKSKFHRSSDKRFIFRTIDKFNCRMWRIADKAVLRTKRKNNGSGAQ
jgi:hypothetical protein